MHHNRLRDSQNVERFQETKAVRRIIMELDIILNIDFPPFFENLLS